MCVCVCVCVCVCLSENVVIWLCCSVCCCVVLCYSCCDVLESIAVCYSLVFIWYNAAVMLLLSLEFHIAAVPFCAAAFTPARPLNRTSVVRQSRVTMVRHTDARTRNTHQIALIKSHSRYSEYEKEFYPPRSIAGQ